ncbi:MAG: 4Fe-4S dicluster domain-containing protein [Thermoplasmata archaeon]|nr:MAG: 4Fe-4S dicluster domain-containing protein [Thermoplasmata archaeon]
MIKSDSKEYSLFTGCLIPSKFPFIEKASRMVLEKLGVKLHAIEGASCCPNQMAIQSSSYELWEVLAARNLSLAEQNGHDILSLCNGCYDTLKTINSRLKNDEKFKNEINLLLKNFGLEYHGDIDVKHILQVLHDDIGLNAIDTKVDKRLKNLKCAPFVGCHVKRPMDHMGFDDPEKPYYLEDLVKVIGGDVISYPEKHSCCSGGLSIARSDDVAPSARRMLKSILDSGGEALVVNCPYCFAQFFRNIKEVNDIYSDSIELPVFYITQLIGVAFGFEPEEMGMNIHYDFSSGTEETVVEHILSTGQDHEVHSGEVTASQLEICSGCRACTDDCSTAMVVPEYHPEEILDLVLSGKVEEALKRPDIWYCMNCHECIQHCPQNFGMVKLLVRLKNLAVQNGIFPEVVANRRASLQDTSYSFEPDNELRQKMGLDKIKGPELEAFRKLVEEVVRGNK